MWKTGIINGYFWSAKVFDTGSEYGIDNGRISKLQICKGDRWDHNTNIYNYDRGLDFDECPAGVLKMVMEDILK